MSLYAGWQHLIPQLHVSNRGSPYPGAFFPLLFPIFVIFLDLNWDLLHINLLPFLNISFHQPLRSLFSFFNHPLPAYLRYSHSPYLSIVAPQGRGWGGGVSAETEETETLAAQISGGRGRELVKVRYLSLAYGHSDKEGKMYGGDWKSEGGGGGGAIEAEGSIKSARCVGGGFSSRSRGKFIYFPGSYNEILLSTLLWWWEQISSHKFVLPFGCQWWTIYYAAFKDTAWYLYDTAILYNDIHFIVPYNTNEKIKSKTAWRRASPALFIAM